MSCVHLQTLFQICEDRQLQFSSTEMVRMVCDECQRDDVCPSMQMEHLEAKYPDSGAKKSPQSPQTVKN